MGYWCLPDGHAGWIEIDLTNSLQRSQLDSIIRPLALKKDEAAIVMWNTHNNRHEDRGATRCDLRLFLGNREVWKKAGVTLPWSTTEEPHVTLRPPNLKFDKVRVDVVNYALAGGGLSEIAIIRDGMNVARCGRARCSAMFHPTFSASRINDGIMDSNTDRVGYWLLPSRQAGWIEIDCKNELAEPALPQLDARPGEWNDLLRFAGRKQDIVSGTWWMSQHAIESAAEDLTARITIPVVPLGEYDLEVEFTRTLSKGYTCLFVPVESRTAMIVLATNQCGLERIDRRRWNDNATFGSGQVDLGKKHKVFVSVRRLDATASIRMELDGREVISWKGDPSSLSLNADWSMPWVNALGLGSMQSKDVFHSVRIRMINGKLGTEPDLKRFVRP